MRLFIFACLCCINLVAHAELVGLDDRSFVSKHTLVIKASPERVWQALTRDIGLCWDPAHTRSGDAANLLMQTRVGGCFCEILEDKKFEHLRVIVVYENQELRLRGGLGPLQSMGASGTMRFRLLPSGNITRLDYKYVVSVSNAKSVAQDVDEVQLAQLERLQKYIEGR